MATQTTNLGLTKPGYDEAADVVPAVNNNMDTLDQKIGAVPANSSVQGQLDSHTQAIGNLANLTTTEKGSLVGATNELNSKMAKYAIVHGTAPDSIGLATWSDKPADLTGYYLMALYQVDSGGLYLISSVLGSNSIGINGNALMFYIADAAGVSAWGGKSLVAVLVKPGT